MPDCRLDSKLGDGHTTCVSSAVATGGGVGRRVDERKVTAGRSANGRLRRDGGDRRQPDTHRGKRNNGRPERRDGESDQRERKRMREKINKNAFFAFKCDRLSLGSAPPGG